VPTLPSCQHQSLLWLPHPAPLVSRVRAPSRWLHPQSGASGQKPCQCQTLGRAWRARYTAASPSAALWVLSSKHCAALSSHLNPAAAPESEVRLQPLPLCRTRTTRYHTVVCQERLSFQPHHQQQKSFCSGPVAQGSLMEQGIPCSTQPQALSSWATLLRVPGSGVSH